MECLVQEKFLEAARSSVAALEAAGSTVVHAVGGWAGLAGILAAGSAPAE